MALPTQTFATLKAAAAHAIGRTPDTGTSTGDIVNNALLYLQNRHPWKWLQRALSVNFVADQSHAALATDFRALAPGVPLAGPANSSRRVLPASLEDIIRLRQMSAGGIADTYFALSWTTQASATSLPIARLELYPTPAANETGALIGMYIRTLDALSGDTDVPNIPSHLHSLLRQLCRAHAHSDEEPTDPETGSEWALALEMLNNEIANDGMSQSRIGVIRGAVSYGWSLTSHEDRQFYPYNGVGIA